MARSGWVAVAITAILVAGLGNRAMVERATEAGVGTRDLLVSLTTFPVWSTQSFEDGSDLVVPLAVKVVLCLLTVFLGAGLAGRVGTSSAAFLGGWGAVMVSAALAGAVFWPVADATAFDGQLSDTQGGVVPLIVRGLNDGVVFGLYTGWLVGLSLLVTARAPRPEPEWLADQTPPPPAPATSTSYPTIYPPLPGSGEWTGLTAPLPKVRPVTGQTPVQPQAQPQPKPQPQPQPQPQAQRQPPAEDPRPLWPRSLPSNAPDGGAYSTQRQNRRPNWTRWSSRDDDATE